MIRVSQVNNAGNNLQEEHNEYQAAVYMHIVGVPRVEFDTMQDPGTPVTVKPKTETVNDCAATSEAGITSTLISEGTGHNMANKDFPGVGEAAQIIMQILELGTDRRSMANRFLECQRKEVASRETRESNRLVRPGSKAAVMRMVPSK